MRKIRRINFYAASGCGKSTLAAEVYARLKRSGYNVELVREVIKLMAYQGRFPKSFKQGKVFFDQLDLEDDHLEHVDLIVSDSPLHMNVAYSLHYGFECTSELLSIANKFDCKFPSVNYWSYRKWEYNVAGRYQNEDESKVLDKIIRDVAVNNIDGSRVFFDDMTLEDLIAHIRKEIDS